MTKIAHWFCTIHPHVMLVVIWDRKGRKRTRSAFCPQCWREAWRKALDLETIRGYLLARGEI